MEQKTELNQYAMKQAITLLQDTCHGMARDSGWWTDLKTGEQAPAQPAAVAEPVAYRVLRKRHDGEWVTDGRAWCDGVPTQDLVDDIALRSDGWRIEYAFAAPAIGAPAAQGGVLPSLFREALAWGMTYGPEIPAHQWEEMRESMVEKFTARAQAKEGRDMAITKQQRAALREKFDGRCAYCGHPLGEKWHADGGSA